MAVPFFLLCRNIENIRKRIVPQALYSYSSRKVTNTEKEYEKILAEAINS